MNQGAQDPLPLRHGAGKRNLDIFMLGSKKSPICFYFEDEGCEELYTRLLGRLFPNYKNPLVICTGGKSKKVLEEADALKLSPVVVIHDKDFDDLIGTLSNDQRIVTLHRYSFENYLLEPNALIEIAIESKRRLRRSDAEKKLDLTQYLSDLYGSYVPLAALFVISRRLNLKRIKTTKQPISEIVSMESRIISEEDVVRFKDEVIRAAQKDQRISNPQEIQDLMSTALTPKPKYDTHADEHPNAHLCGKHLLDLTLSYVDSILETKLSEADRFEISMRLVIHLSEEIFTRVKREIISSLTSQGTHHETLSLMT